MRRILVLVFSLCAGLSFGQTIRPIEIVKESLSSGKQFKSSPIFRLSPQNFRNTLPQEIEEYDLLSLQKDQINAILNEDFSTLEIPIPSNSRSSKILQLVEVENMDFLVKDGLNGNVIPYEGGKHYRGIIKGKENSLVAISIFKDEMMGLIMDPDEYGNQVIGKMENESTYIIYNDPGVLEKLPFTCDTDDSGINISEEEMRGSNIDTRALSDCVRFLFEVDNELTNAKGGTTGVTNYVTAVYNQVAILYANEQINTSISEINVYTDANDPYSGNTSNMLSQVSSRMSGGFNGDLAMVLGYNLGGGVAYVSGLCAQDRYRVGVSGISASYSNVPTYSWTVNVVTHEFGHLLGSPHTHACSWSGGALDNCGPSVGYSEGCSGPNIPQNTGTIMSYCHLTSVGIDFNYGFGTQPGNLIRSRVSAASCLSACATGGGATCSDGIQNQGETSVDCGGPCTACPATCNDGIQNGNETGVDCGGSCAPCGGTGGGNIFGHYFESGWDGWIDGGSDCARISSSSYSYEGNYSIQIRDNSGTASSMTSAAYNLSGQSSVTFTFSFYMNSMENGEDFFLDFYNGSSWVRLGTYAAGSTYSNNTFYTKSISINSGLSSNNKFRFTCDASTNSDQVYIDAVTLSGNSGGGPTCSDGVRNGNETGVDCGGDCPACPTTPTCTDGVKNGNETGVDCGGDCPACPTCTDGVKNGNETGVDCGGPSCPACPSCNDGIQNGNETGVDCGGPDCAPCGGTGGVALFGNGHYFETGMDGWSDGGSDCARVSSSFYAAEGNYSIQLRDNSGISSSMTSPGVNLNAYSSITLEFGMYANSMETGEQMLIKFGNGGSFTTLFAATSGVDFSNGIHYTVTIDLSSSAVSFGSNSQIRIECNASTNSDQLYIDAVKLTGNQGNLASLVSEVNFEAEPSAQSTFTSGSIFYPNPASDVLNIELQNFMDEEDEESSDFSQINLSIYSITGQVVKTLVLDQNYGSKYQIDISDLPSGTYLARAIVGDEPIVEKIQVIR